MVTLTPEELWHIEEAVSAIIVAGDRYPQAEAERTQR
jgi:hypothetical protein